MEITKIKIKKLIPYDNHIGFVSCVIDDWLYLGNIAIFERREPNTIRLVFPEKKVGNRVISIFHPLTDKAYFNLEKKILEKLIDTKQEYLNTNT